MKKIKFYVFLFLVLVILIFGINFVSGYFSDRVTLYVNSKATVYASKYIEQSIREGVIDQIDIESLCYFQESSSDEKVISAIHINTNQINKILSNVNLSINQSLETLTKENLSLPMGIVFSDTLFTNLGPNLKIKIVPIGNYICDVITEVEQYGINNNIFKVSIKVDININTIIPFKKATTSVSCKIPIVMEVINGEVPRYYYNTTDIIPDIYDQS